MKRTFLVLAALVGAAQLALAQPVPGADENIPFLVTFGGDSQTEWGDDNFLQIIFFSIPLDQTQPFYIRVFDPDCGGEHDELRGTWNTKTRFSVFGGANSCSSNDAKRGNKNGDYDSGTLLATKTFGQDPKTDNNWYTFGPFNPSEGEVVKEIEGSRCFKLVIEGLSGDDGNMYRLFLSRKKDDNVKVDGATAYYFKYKFRMYDTADQVSHIYPLIDSETVSIKQSNFDWDNDGMLRIISVSKNGQMMTVSNNDEWKTSTHKIDEAEKGTSWDIQMIKLKSRPLKNNNVVIFLENQYGELLPFYSIPMGGIPKYKYGIGTRPQAKKKVQNK